MRCSRVRLGNFSPSGNVAARSPRPTRNKVGRTLLRPAGYESGLPGGFHCPPRLRGREGSTVEEANDWYFAMLNDSQRNEFFLQALSARVQGKIVVDIGAGCGLLSMMAAKLGAKGVLAVERCRDLAQLARRNVAQNGFAEVVRVVHADSFDLTLPPEGLADVIVSETLGTMMLGEGLLHNLAHARDSLAHPGAAVIPSHGVQHATLIASSTLEGLAGTPTAAETGFDLSATDSLRDTACLFFSKRRGLRMSSLPDLVEMSERSCILSADFRRAQPSDVPPSQTVELRALRDGVVHAVMTSWEVWDNEDPTLRMATHVDATKDAPWGLARDLHWGQAIQFLEDAGKQSRKAARVGKLVGPAPFVVKAGEVLLLDVRFSTPDLAACQFRLRRRDETGASADFVT